MSVSALVLNNKAPWTCKNFVKNSFIPLYQLFQKRKHTHCEKNFWSKFLLCACVDNLEFTILPVQATC